MRGAQRQMSPVACLVLASFVLASPAVRADPRYGMEPAAGGYTLSTGFPHLWHLEVGFGGGLSLSSPRDPGGEARLRISRDLVYPALSLLSLTLEGSLGAHGTDFTSSGRLMLTSLALRLGVGVDCELTTRRFSPIFSFIHPLRRGGLVGRSSLFRFDWIPGQDNEILFGLQFSLERSGELGAPRPVDDTAPLPGRPAREPSGRDHPRELLAAMDEIHERARWIYRLTVPYLAWDGSTRAEAMAKVERQLDGLAAHLDRAGPDPKESVPIREQRAFHALIERAFSIAAGGDTIPAGTTELGRALAKDARDELLEGVLLPYDRLLGQTKDPDTVLGLGEFAAGRFLEVAATRHALQGRRLAEAAWAFDELVRAIEEVREEAHRDWDDSRLAWLPLQLALLPEECATKEQLDALVERLVDERFTDDNRVHYVANQRFQAELEASVEAAVDYHVLWMHDIAGKNPRGELDAQTFSDVVDVYLPALTKKIENYDTTGKLPVYMIFLDQWYYEATDGRRWLRVLEDPLDPNPPLPPGYDEWKKRLVAAQARLASAVEHSQLLQSQAALHGSAWLRNRVQVHVSITNRAAPAYFRWGWIPWAGFPDDAMRDHRKIIFYDLADDDPYRGLAVFAGMGVGEEYQRPKWEDRAIIAQGPALQHLREAARELLRLQGVPPDEIPWALRETPPPVAAAAAQKPDIPLGLRARAMQVQNQTGYGEKRATVLKAAMYTLLPPGTVEVVPDSLWTNALWAGMLVGHALRGGRVLIVLPGPSGAPSNNFPQMSVMQELATRLLATSRRLGPQIELAQGLLRVGIFEPDHDVTDEPALVAAQRENLERQPFLRALLGFGDDVLQAFRDGETRSRAALSDLQLPPAERGGQLLHVKVNAFVLPDQWRALMARPEWARLFALHIDERIGTLKSFATGADPAPRTPAIDFEKAAAPLAAQMLDLPDPQRAGMWLVVGSQNMDLRGMLLDGEVVVATTGAQDVIALMDLLTLALESRWVDSQEELDAVFPPYPEWKRDIGRFMRVIL